LQSLQSLRGCNLGGKITPKIIVSNQSF
jgi:hypothetical protein